MTASAPPPAAAAPEAEALVLRASPQLQAAPRGQPPSAAASEPTAAEGLQARVAPPQAPSWLLFGLAALATAGWLLERRRRRELETDKDSVLWAGVQASGSSIITEVDEPETEPTLPAGPVGAGARREATLTDLHELERKLQRRCASGDLLSAVLLLQQHIADFRFTSPMVFLELRELYHQLSRERDWELAREVFLLRFGQRAPLWQAPSTAAAELGDDAVICDEIVAEWPYREARVAILRWVLGEPETPQQPHRPPVLALGVYRDLLFLDRLLDQVLITRAAPVDSLL